MPDQPVPSDHDLSVQLRGVMHALRRHSMTALEPYGLSPHQGRAFLTIGRAADLGEPMRLKDLAERLRIAARSATEVVDALETQGLVSRGADPNDRRATVLTVTDKGTVVLQRVRAAQSAQPALAGLSDADRRRLGAILEQMLTAVDDPRPQ